VATPFFDTLALVGVIEAAMEEGNGSGAEGSDLLSLLSMAGCFSSSASVI
jgi:hypothetical protein